MRLGLAAGPGEPRPQHDGAGGHRHDQHHRQGRPRLLPRVLQGCAQQIPRGGPGAVLSDYVQGLKLEIWISFKILCYLLLHIGKVHSLYTNGFSLFVLTEFFLLQFLQILSTLYPYVFLSMSLTL